MDFPTLLNKWVIGYKPIRHTIFWYWYRFINHSEWRLDDHYLWKEFWLNLNHGWEHMNYVHNFEKFWGKGSYPPLKITVSQEDYEFIFGKLNDSTSEDFS